MATPLSEALVRLRADPTGLAQSIERETDLAVARAGPARVPIQPVIGPGAAVTWERIPGSPGQVLVPVQPQLPAGASTRLAQTLEQQVAAGVGAGVASGLAQRTPGGRQSRFGGELSREFQAAAQAAGGLGQRLSQQLAFFGPTGLAVGATTLAIGASAKAFADFEAELNTFGVVSEATNRQMEDASDLAKQLGADLTLPGVSAADAAVSMTELAKAGISINDTFAGTEGVLQLATAAQIDFASAAELTASALNAFRLPGSDATQVADLLTGAANAAQGSIGDMGLALRQASAVARLAGFSLDETVTSLTILAQSGIAGSDAGTSLRTTLLRLIAPSNEAQRILDALGVSIRDAAGNITPETFDRLRQSLNRLSPATRQTALAMIFGADAVRAASFLTERSTRQFDQLEQRVSRAGQAAEVTAARSSGLRGAFDGVVSSAQNLGIEVGEFFAPSLEKAADGTSGLLGGLTDLFEFMNTHDFKIIDILPGDSEETGVREFFSNLLDPNEEQQVKEFFVDGKDNVVAFGNAVADVAGHFGFLGDAIGQSRTEFQALADLSGVSTQSMAKSLIEGRRAAENTTGALTEAFLRQGNVTAEAQSRATDVSDKIAGLSPVFRTTGKKLGESLIDGVEQGIIDNQRKAVDAARRNLTEVIQAGEDLIEQTVLQAQRNLVSIGSELAAQAVALIDAGPLGQRIAQLQARLDASRRGRDRGRLRDDLRTARAELAAAERQVATARGPRTAAQQQAVDEFLRPFVQKVKDAQAAINEFNTEGVLDRLRKTADDQKATVTKGIADVVAAFNAGSINALQAQNRIAQVLGQAIPNYRKAGASLGLAFRQEFLATLAGLRAQINAIVAGPDPKTSGAGPDVVSTQDAVTRAARDTADAQRRLRESQDELRKAINDAKKKETENTDDLSGTMKTLITTIEAEIRSRGGTVPKKSNTTREEPVPSR